MTCSFFLVHPYLLAAWLSALVVATMVTLSLPLVVSDLIDHGVTNTDLTKSFGQILIIAFVLALSTSARFYFISVLGERIVFDLRTQLYSHLIKLDQQFYGRNNTGELASRLAVDTALLRNVVVTVVPAIIRGSMILVGCAAMIVITSPRLAAASLLSLPLFMLPPILSGRILHRVSRESQDSIAAVNTIAVETLGAVRTVQAYSREDVESTRYRKSLSRYLSVTYERIRVQTIVIATSITSVFFAIVLVLWYGSLNVVSGHLTFGDMGQFVLYALIGAGSVTTLAEVWNELQRASGGMTRIRKLLDEDSVVRPPKKPRPVLAPFHGDLEFRDVVFRYSDSDEKPALDGVGFSIKRGETVAFVGPSGAGKSTVFNLILRFYDPHCGIVLLDNVDIREIDISLVRSQIAFVPQQPVIFSASARDNIRYGRTDSSDTDIEDVARLAEAWGFLGALPAGLDESLGERGARLSGGQQQRIAIARAMLRDAPILLLDEATSALDAKNEQSVQCALDKLMRDRTTLIIAHRLSTVLKADRILVMDEGRVVAVGTHAELMAAGGLYAELAKLQFLH